jgi:hypothetical protein
MLQLERLEKQGVTWQRWQALLRGEGSREALDVWRQELEEQIESRAQMEIQRKGQRADLERRLEGLQARHADDRELPS